VVELVVAEGLADLQVQFKKSVPAAAAAVILSLLLTQRLFQILFQHLEPMVHLGRPQQRLLQQEMLEQSLFNTHKIFILKS
jgi:hypothetical protein